MWLKKGEIFSNTFFFFEAFEDSSCFLPQKKTRTASNSDSEFTKEGPLLPPSTLFNLIQRLVEVRTWSSHAWVFLTNLLTQWFLTWVRSNPRGSVSQFQGFGSKRFWAIKVNKKIHDTHFIFATTKDSMNACMELIGFCTSNKVKNHCNLTKASDI